MTSDSGVKVRELEWSGRNADGSIHIAYNGPMQYWAWELAGYGYWSWGVLAGREVSGGLDAAKAAAQADYEDRIRSALITAQPADAGMREALAEIKLIALTAGAPGGLATHSALSRIVRLCRDAGITETMTEIRTALTAPGATTKSDGSASQPQPVATDQLAGANTANGPSDPSSTRSGRWVCAARQRGITLDPQDCDWPVCGCDPLASKVLDTIAESGFIIVPKDGASMTDDQIKHMVDRFLTWKLPEHFNPDCGISFDQSYRSEHGPVGTNLFDAVQATAMVRHMLEGFPSTASLQGEDAVERVARIKSLLASFHRNSCYPEAMTGELNDAAARILATGLVPDEAVVRGDEREKCAKVAEAECYATTGRQIAAAIRSNGRGA